MVENITSASALWVKASFASLSSSSQQDVYKSLNQRCRAILLEALKTDDYESRFVNAYGFNESTAPLVYADLTSILALIETARSSEEEPSEAPLFNEDKSLSASILRLIKGALNILGRKGSRDLESALKGLNGFDHQKYSLDKIIENRSEKIAQYEAEKAELQAKLTTETDKKARQKGQNEIDSLTNRISILAIDLEQMLDIQDSINRASGAPVEEPQIIDLDSSPGSQRAQESDGEQFGIERAEESDSEIIEEEPVVATLSPKAQEIVQNYTQSILSDLQEALKQTTRDFLAERIEEVQGSLKRLEKMAYDPQNDLSREVAESVLQGLRQQLASLS